MNAQQHQELKDALWRLDNDVEASVSAIIHATGDAWKQSVEFGAYRRQLLHAANLARDLEARIRATIDDLPTIVGERAK